MRPYLLAVNHAYIFFCVSLYLGLFWSLNFAVRRTVWDELGGFDEGFGGYGGEYTDLAFTARQTQLTPEDDPAKMPSSTSRSRAVSKLSRSGMV